jgi:hypothetical protein
MKKCPRCGQEIAESESACSFCRSDSVSHVQALPPPAAASENAPSVAQPPTASAPPPMSSPAALAAAGGKNKRWMMAAVLLGGAVLSMIVLRLVSSTSRSTAEARSAPGARPAPAVSSAPAPRVPAKITPKWSSANPDWLGNDPKAVAFEVPAQERVQIWQRKAHPSLVVRCSMKQIEVFVFIESAAKMEAQDSDHTVRLTFDDAPEVTERWPDSYQHNALFAPDGAAFADRLSQARILHFGYTPHNASPVVAEFHVAGLPERLATAAKQCGLKK